VENDRLQPVLEEGRAWLSQGRRFDLAQRAPPRALGRAAEACREGGGVKGRRAGRRGNNGIRASAEARSFGGHATKSHSSTIDAVKQDTRITARLRELLEP